MDTEETDLYDIFIDKNKENSDTTLAVAEKVPQRNWLPNGKFAPGNRLGKGNSPNHAKLLAYRRTIWNAVSADDVREIIKKAVQQAKEGNAIAREFLFDRLLGKPVAHVEANVNDGTTKTYVSICIDEV